MSGRTTAGNFIWGIEKEKEIGLLAERVCGGTELSEWILPYYALEEEAPTR